MQLHLVAEQNKNITLASFGPVSLIFEEGSKGVIWCEETARVLVILGQIYFKSASPKI